MEEQRIKSILIITSEAFPYGMAGTNRIISLAKGFKLNGIEVEVLSIFKYGKSYSQINFPVHGTYEGIAYTNVLIAEAKHLTRLERVIKRNICLLLILIYLIRKVDKNTKILYYSPWIWPALLVRLFTLFRRNILVKEETEHPSLRLKGKSKIYRTIYLNHYYQIFDGLFVITQNLHDFFVRELRYRKPILIVPMVVDLESYTNDNKTIHNTIVFSGELDIEKEGLDILLCAFAAFVGKHPEYVLDLYGKPVSHTQELRISDLIAQLSLSKSVRLNGFKTRDELTEILSTARILVFTRPPSLQAKYGFSTKLGEYLAVGKPVIATKVGEIDHYLVDRVNAFLADPECFSVHAKMEEIVNDYEFALEVGKEARNCAIINFNNKIEAERIIIFFRSVGAS